MGTFTKGHTYTNTATLNEITACNLSSLMNNAGFGSVARADMVGGLAGITATNSEPDSLTNGELWYDTVNTRLMRSNGTKSLGVDRRVELFFGANKHSIPSASRHTGSPLIWRTSVDDAVITPSGAIPIRFAGIALAPIPQSTQEPLRICAYGVCNVSVFDTVVRGEYLHIASGARPRGIGSRAGLNTFGIFLEDGAAGTMVKCMLGKHVINDP